MLLITTVPAMFLAARGVPPLRLVAATMLGGALTAGGGNALNMVWDRDIDARMPRTCHRPLVTGVVSPRAAVVFAMSLEAGGFVILWTQDNLLAALLAIGAAAYYLGVYTMALKRTTRLNVVIGGAAGAMPVLVGWAAVAGTVGAPAWVLFAIILLWTPPHSWALAMRYRDDYARARVPMLPAVAAGRVVAGQILAFVVLLVGASVVLAPVGDLGLAYLTGAGALGAAFTAMSWRFVRSASPGRAMALFHFSNAYLALLFISVAVAAIGR